MRYLPFAVSALILWAFAGCTPPKIYRYPGFTIRADAPAQVERDCDVKRWDDGRAWHYKDNPPAGCWRPREKEILVRWDCSGAKAIPHELAHKFKVWRDTYTSEYSWPE